MHLYDAIEEYNFTHGKHFNTVTGQYDLLMPHDLGRPLTHEEMDYNFLYQKQTMNGFRIFGSGANYKLNIDDIDKVLKFHKIATTDENYSAYTDAGYVADQYIWIPVEMAAAAQPAYVTLTANPTTINETGNSTVTFTLNVVNVEDATTIDWSIATGSGITANDFVGGLTGTATINGNTATWDVQAKADNFTEGLESFTLTIATTDSAGNDTTTMSQDANGNGGVPLSATVAIGDTSYTPQYNSITSANSVNEGASITFTVNTSYFFQAATADWLVDFANSTATSADFTGATTGTVNLDANGDGTFSVAIASDLINDSDNFTVKLTGNDSNGINTNEISKTVTISNAAFPTYTTFTGPATRIEGQNVQYALNGTNIPNGTQVGYTISSSDPNFTLDDISLNSLTGFITMNSNFGQLFFGISEDYTVESDETITVTLDSQDNAGNATGLPMDVQTVISDAAPTYSITGPSSISEGAADTYTFKATNMVPLTTVYWELRNYGASNTFVEFTSDFVTARTGNGQVQATSNPGEVELGIDIEVASDMASESGENFQLIVWDDASNYDTLLPYSAPVNGALATKNITITEVSFSHNLAPYNDTQGVWGGSNGYQNETPNTTYEFQHFILNNDNDPNNPGDLLFPTGTTVYWRVEPYTAGTGNSAVEAEDFVGDVFPSGSYQTAPAGQGFSASTQAVGVWSVTIKEDNLTDGTSQELYWMKIYSDAQYTNQLAQMTVSVQDTSQSPAAQGYYFHGGNQSYPFAQAADGLTAANPGTMYYDDGSNSFASTTDLSVAMSYIMDNMGATYSPGNYTVSSFSIPNAGITALGSSDALNFGAMNDGGGEYYYIILPDGNVDLTSTNPQHLIDGGLATNAVQKASFTWQGGVYWLYRLGGGSQTAARTITFSDND